MNNQSKVLKWSLIIGMVIVLNLFFNYSISLIYKSPDYNTFCPPMPATAEPGNPITDAQYTACQNNFQTAQDNYDKNVFIALVVLGVICIAIGNFLKGNAVVGVALSMAGVLSFIIASMRYWSSADNLIKVIILAIALGILVWVAMKKFSNKPQNEGI